MRRMPTVCSIVMLSVLACTLALADGAPRKKLIAVGWDMANPERFLKNMEEMETRPFQGVVLRFAGPGNKPAFWYTFSREAWALLGVNFARVINDPTDLDARSGMQLGACFAGLAIENSMLGATHALANPLTATYGIVHGQAIGMMLPYVIRFNGEQFPKWYQDLLETTAGGNGIPESHTGAEGLADYVSLLVELAGLPRRLSECNVQREKLPELAAAAAQQWTGNFNPRDVGQDELLSLYERAF